MARKSATPSFWIVALCILGALVLMLWFKLKLGP